MIYDVVCVCVVDGSEILIDDVFVLCVVEV